MNTLSRREALVRLGALATAMWIPLPLMAQARRIRHFWWGNPNRDKRTFAFIEAYQKRHADVTVSGETIGWGDYWTKMATQTAGGNMADLVQMDYAYLFEYVRRGALKPLDEYIGKGLQIESFDQSALEGGKVDGKLYALNIGSNSQVIAYNERVFKEAGIEIDLLTWTHETFASACADITKATDGKVLGAEDMSLQYGNFEVWVRQNGRDLHNEDGTLAATVEDVQSYWEFWATLRAAGHVENKDITVVLDKPVSEFGLVKGKSAMAFAFSNQLVALQGLIPDPIKAAMSPHKAGGAYGQFLKPSMFLSMTRDAKDVEAAITYINDWVNDPESYMLLGLERGIPANPAARKALEPTLTPIEAETVRYFDAIQDKVGKLPLPSPKGSGEVRDAFMRIGSEVVLGNTSSKEAATRFVDDASFILERAAR